MTRLRGCGLLVITLTRHGPSRLFLTAVALACAPAVSMASLIARSNSAVEVLADRQVGLDVELARLHAGEGAE